MVNLTPNPDFKARSACVLGATGSVGTQTLDVLRELGIPAVMMTAGSNTELFADIVREFSPASPRSPRRRPRAPLRNASGVTPRPRFCGSGTRSFPPCAKRRRT